MHLVRKYKVETMIGKLSQMEYLVQCIDAVDETFEDLLVEAQKRRIDEWDDETYMGLVRECIGICGTITERCPELRDVVHDLPTNGCHSPEAKALKEFMKKRGLV